MQPTSPQVQAGVLTWAGHDRLGKREVGQT
jgi:hypothetical protein